MVNRGVKALSPRGVTDADFVDRWNREFFPVLQQLTSSVWQKHTVIGGPVAVAAGVDTLLATLGTFAFAADTLIAINASITTTNGGVDAELYLRVADANGNVQPDELLLALLAGAGVVTPLPGFLSFASIFVPSAQLPGLFVAQFFVRCANALSVDAFTLGIAVL